MSTSVSQKRTKFLTEIHEICFYGQGGYSWTEVYEMPLWLRKFVYGKIKQHYDKQSEEIKKAQSKSKGSPNTKNLVNSGGTPSKSSYK